MSEYYIRIGGEQRGPFSRFQLESQPISDSTPVLQVGTDQWRQAADFPELRSLLGGGQAEQYGQFRDLIPESTPYQSPYASPQADLRPAPPKGGTLPRMLGMISCGLGGLTWLLVFAFFGFVVYMVILEEQGGGEPSEGMFALVGLGFCFNFVLMLAGLLLGLIGVVVPGQGRGWAIAGLVVNGLPLVMMMGLFLIGAMFG
ncbi:DUF4339 domain-containing protein [Blastopirellula marina]|uniref:GYF domain-containing protein n=1 Tax=Blastopirellula marina TaxID=124 RepID=A0A2S8GKI8_9BACT|nr:DUF4339 domain-containing protein [Blastopirellula marina]PQO44946.1 hypothetical protein C5Y93_15500 [Blastopirellula marina]